jgi:hypothetical protein
LLAHQPGNLARTRSVITAPVAIAITVVAATPTTFAPIVIPIVIAIVVTIIVTIIVTGVVLTIIGIIGVTADNGGPAASLG